MAQLKGTTEVIGLKQPDSAAKAKQKRMKKYKEMGLNLKNNKMDKDNPICWRFPQLSICGCTRPCRESVQTVQIFEIIPGLFVGPVHGAYKHAYLKDKNIKKILNISNEKYYKNEKWFEYLQIDIEDAIASQIIKYFKTTNKFIDDALSSQQGVYVHCRAGISRSPSFIMAYLMWKQSIGYQQADKIVGRVHPFANPNSSFVRQLEEYEKRLQQNVLFKLSKKMNLEKINKSKVSKQIDEGEENKSKKKKIAIAHV
eukprot:841785_1